MTDARPRQSFHSISFRATASTISLLNTTITETALEQLHDVADCFLGLSFQPITQAWLAAARASGGDAIDLDPAAGTFIGKHNTPSRPPPVALLCFYRTRKTVVPAGG